MHRTPLVVIVCGAFLLVFGGSAQAARLSGLSVNGGSLSPGFNGGIFSYTCTVDASVAAISVTATARQARRTTLTVDGVITQSATASAPISLAAGQTTITITSTVAQRTDVYTISVTREDATIDNGQGNDPSRQPGSEPGSELPPGPTIGGAPNVLLLVADDVGVEASSLYPQYAGTNGAAPMPTIEGLAAKGLVFDNAWASPMCSPTRATILTGLYANRNGVTAPGKRMDPASTLYHYIAASSPNQYDTAVFGKWHLSGTNSNAASDLLLGAEHVRDAGVQTYRGFAGAGIADYFNWQWVDQNGNVTDDTTYSTTALTNFAISYIQSRPTGPTAKPWFVYLPYNAAHEVFQVPPSNLYSTNVGALQPGDMQTSVPVYQSMIQAMDTEIARLLSVVDLTHTVVIYIGDNGTPSNVKDSATGVRGSKSSVYEGGVHVPLVIAGAGVTRAGHEEGLVVSSDLYATIAALSGIGVSQINDSYSLLPLLSDPLASSGRTHAFTELCNGGSRYAIRDERYKLLYSGSWQMYDLLSDPLEKANLYRDSNYAAAKSSLQAELDAIKARSTAGCFQ